MSRGEVLLDSDWSKKAVEPKEWQHNGTQPVANLLGIFYYDRSHEVSMYPCHLARLLDC